MCKRCVARFLKPVEVTVEEEQDMSSKDTSGYALLNGSPGQKPLRASRRTARALKVFTVAAECHRPHSAECPQWRGTCE